MKNTNKKHAINHEEIQQSLESFLKKGGKIDVLPPQRVVTREKVGGDKWGMYIALEDIQPNSWN
ncbi:MAG: hypothetical protein HQM12_01880 [SAR324 cluster bacterium]|nr:hypothetical protein [SAR324 cluster bacterium]MBF0350516.1 hypothetical protein [SAR324 cluster bacterium]